MQIYSEIVQNFDVMEVINHSTEDMEDEKDKTKMRSFRGIETWIATTILWKGWRPPAYLGAAGAPENALSCMTCGNSYFKYSCQAVIWENTGTFWGVIMQKCSCCFSWFLWPTLVTSSDHRGYASCLPALLVFFSFAASATQRHTQSGKCPKSKVIFWNLVITKSVRIKT